MSHNPGFTDEEIHILLEEKEKSNDVKTEKSSKDVQEQPKVKDKEIKDEKEYHDGKEIQWETNTEESADEEW